MRACLSLAGGIAALLVLVAAGIGAQSAPDGATRPGPGRHRGARLNLNLTDDQRAQMRTLMEQHRDAMAPQRQALGDLYRQLRTEGLADAPDQAKIDQLRSQIVQAQGALMTARLGLAQQLAQVLRSEEHTSELQSQR